MGSFLTLGVLVFVAVILFAFLMKSSPSGQQAPAIFSQPAPTAVQGEHDAAITVMSEWYREAKRKEFEEGVLKDVVEKFSKKVV